MTNQEGKPSAYAAAGVNIDAQDEALDEVKRLAHSTFTPGVLTEIGSFGGLFQPNFGAMTEPVIVASADGVGTKLMVAGMANDYSTVGLDLVNHCVNDILVQGATPLFFMDYVGAGILEPNRVVELVRGVAEGCRGNGCALLGGETAEMPGFYQPGDFELVGFVVGLADKSKILDGSRIREGDKLIGLASSGLHTNGYSLARTILFDQLKLKPQDLLPLEGSRHRTVVAELLEPHRSYLAAVRPWLADHSLHGLAHITGGGLTDNLPRILPPGCGVDIYLGSWEIPEIFTFLATEGQVEKEEMFRVFNMGIGLVLVVDQDHAATTISMLRSAGERAAEIGVVTSGDREVSYRTLEADGR
ncbi:MAG: phosphoribosylformylglycinamidine cyclo-ligase [Deltaproteobacteria bacterium]|nr:phosphoribosylformylglycinamidine cyclo-ligase [Deltaproteobacteria bacterium]